MSEDTVEAELPIMWEDATYQVTIQLFDDEKEEESTNLTGLVVELDIGEIALTEGKGLTVTHKSGTIEVEVPPNEVSRFSNARTFTLWTSGPFEPRSPLIYGVFRVGGTTT